MATNDESSHRRPGPIGFHAESKVTTQRHGPGSNIGGMGEALGPIRQTPTRSRELRVAPVAIWGFVGLVIAVIGVVLLQPLVGVAGLMVVAGAFLAHRANRTEGRLRDEARNRNAN